MYVNGTVWAPYLCLEFSIAFVVTVMEGAISGSVPVCSAKCVVALFLVAIQLAVLIVKRPLGARFDQVAATLAVGLSLLSGTLMTAGLMTSNTVPEVSITASFVMIAASLVVTVQGIVGMSTMIISITATLKQILHFIKMRRVQRRVNELELDNGDLDSSFYGGPIHQPTRNNNSASGSSGNRSSLLSSVIAVVRASFTRTPTTSPPTPAVEPSLPQQQNESWNEFLDELEMEDNLRSSAAAASSSAQPSPMIRNSNVHIIQSQKQKKSPHNKHKRSRSDTLVNSFFGIFNSFGHDPTVTSQSFASPPPGAENWNGFLDELEMEDFQHAVSKKTKRWKNAGESNGEQVELTTETESSDAAGKNSKSSTWSCYSQSGIVSRSSLTREELQEIFEEC